MTASVARQEQRWVASLVRYVQAGGPVGQGVTVRVCVLGGRGAVAEGHQAACAVLSLPLPTDEGSHVASAFVVLLMVNAP